MIAPCPALARRTCIGRRPGTARLSGTSASARGHGIGFGPISVDRISMPSTRRPYGSAGPGQGRAAAGTLAWLIARYRETSAWAALSAATRRQRENIFTACPRDAPARSHSPESRRTPSVAGLERRARDATGATFLDAMRGLFRWALGSEAGQSRSDHRCREPSPQEGRRLHPLDRGACRGV